MIRDYPHETVNVVLPDGTALELPDGASGLDAARAIGPKLAEQAVLIKVDGEPQRPPPAACRTARSIQILTTRDNARPGRAPVLRHSTAHLLAEAAMRLHPGREDRDRPSDRGRLLLRLRVPRADHARRISRRSRRRSGARSRRGASWEREEITRDDARRPLRGRGAAVQGRARRHRRGRHLALHAGRLHRSLPRAAPAGREPDQGGQAHVARRRLLARRQRRTRS